MKFVHDKTGLCVCIYTSCCTMIHAFFCIWISNIFFHAPSSIQLSTFSTRSHGTEGKNLWIRGNLSIRRYFQIHPRQAWVTLAQQACHGGWETLSVIRLFNPTLHSKAMARILPCPFQISILDHGEKWSSY